MFNIVSISLKVAKQIRVRIILFELHKGDYKND